MRSVEYYRTDGSNDATPDTEQTDRRVCIDRLLERSTGTLRIALWLRDGTGHTVRDVQTQYREQATALESTPRVGEVTVRRWPTRLFRDDDGPSVSDTVHRAVREMETWADENGYSLAPAFQRRVVRSPLSGHRREELTLPIVCLAVHDDAGLAGVAPTRRDGTVYTVEQFYEAIRDTTVEDPATDSAAVGAE